jgi:hypothetical protein
MNYPVHILILSYHKRLDFTNDLFLSSILTLFVFGFNLARVNFPCPTPSL